ncbi:hypothetical protein HZS_7632 [Henneguya salminicola]|nr:hypothetical protein HZS_7632 [Henneguya salminicola]
MARKTKILTPPKMKVNPLLKAEPKIFSLVIDEPKFVRENSLVNNNVPATSMTDYNFNYPINLEQNGYFLENSNIFCRNIPQDFYSFDNPNDMINVAPLLTQFNNFIPDDFKLPGNNISHFVPPPNDFIPNDQNILQNTRYPLQFYEELPSQNVVAEPNFSKCSLIPIVESSQITNKPILQEISNLTSKKICDENIYPTNQVQQKNQNIKKNPTNSKSLTNSSVSMNFLYMILLDSLTNL